MNQKRNMKEKGITLIALVITIIVLLILAGVTINMILGEDGILQRAELAKEEQEKAQDMENIRLAMAERKIDEISKIAPKELKEILETKYGYENVVVTANEDGYVIGFGENRVYSATNEGSVQELVGATTIPHVHNEECYVAHNHSNESCYIDCSNCLGKGKVMCGGEFLCGDDGQGKGVHVCENVYNGTCNYTEPCFMMSSYPNFCVGISQRCIAEIECKMCNGLKTQLNCTKTQDLICGY